MGTCEPGQGRNSAAISSHLFVRWVSHPRPLQSNEFRLRRPVLRPQLRAIGSSDNHGRRNHQGRFDAKPRGAGGRICRRRPPLSAADVRANWSARSTSPKDWPRPSPPAASATPICSPVPAASARRRRPASWPRRSTANAARRPRPATSATSAADHHRRRRGRAGDRRGQQPRHRRNPPAAAEREHASQPRAVQDLHHRRSPHADRARRSTPCSRRSKSRPST